MTTHYAKLNCLQADEVVLNIDVGGGTTDGAAWITSNGFPLRLKKEVVAAKGNLILKFELHWLISYRDHVGRERCERSVPPDANGRFSGWQLSWCS